MYWKMAVLLPMRANPDTRVFFPFFLSFLSSVRMPVAVINAELAARSHVDPRTTCNSYIALINYHKTKTLRMRGHTPILHGFGQTPPLGVSSFRSPRFITSKPNPNVGHIQYTSMLFIYDARPYDHSSTPSAVTSRTRQLHRAAQL